jgi:TRAP-type C4-dicarboxylate transport system permease small subunit
MAGETCPRCHHRDGYPLWQSIPEGQRMHFSCRYCGHKWIKRNSFSVGRWYIYGIGVIIGIIIGIVQLFKFFIEKLEKGLSSFRADPGAFIKSHTLLLVIVIAIIILIIAICIITKKRKNIDNTDDEDEEEEEEEDDDDNE